MPELKEAKHPELSKTVEDSINRIQDIERRIHAVQSEVSTLAGLAGPATGYSTPSRLAMGSSPSWRTAAYAGPATLGSFELINGVGARATVPSGLPPGWAQGGTATPAFQPSIATDGRSSRELQSLPPVVRAPEVNLVDAGDNYVIQVDLPGARKEDLEIVATERTLAIEATVVPKSVEGTVIWAEAVPVHYRRSITMPTAVNLNRCKANLKDGVLSLEVPKKEPTERPRRVDVAYG